MRKGIKNDYLIIGPLPPPIGGTRVSFNLLLTELKKNTDSINVINLNIKEKKIINIVVQVVIFFRIILQIPFYNVISFHANPKRIVWWGSIFLFWSRLFGKKFQIRFFGGDIDLFYEKNIWNRKIIKYISKSNQVLLQTKGLMKYWAENISFTNEIIWFPTNRPKLNTYQNDTIRTYESITFLYVGHVIKEKGIDVLISAYKNLKKKHDNVLLKIIGKCFDPTMLNIMSSEEGIIYKGELQSEDVQKEFCNAHVFVFPSYWRGEGYPGVLIEAMNMGLPIICTNWRYLTELVENGENGFLCKPNDIEDLQDKMQRFINDYSLIIRMSKYSIRKSKMFDSKYWNNEFLKSIIKLNEM